MKPAPSRAGGKPHDSIFREFFSLPEVARQFLERWLPERVRRKIRWETLELQRVCGVGRALRTRAEDVVWRVRYGEAEVKFYILIEHQSGPDGTMPLRCYDYISAVWHHDAQGSGERGAGNRAGAAKGGLPLVVPMVLYPGPGRWSGPERLRQMIAIPEELREWAEQFAPDCGFLLIELAGLGIGEVSGGPASRAVLWALKREREGRLDARAVGQVLGELFGERAAGVIEIVLERLWDYILSEAELSPAEVHAIVEEKVPDEERKEKLMTAAQQLRSEGRQEGRLEGWREGRQEDIIQILEARFGRVPAGMKEAVREVHEDKRLSRLVTAAATCRDLEDFASNLP